MGKLSATFKDKKIIITGHTGFKGSWLTLWLKSLGADITGISLNEHTIPSHYELLDLNDKIKDFRFNICLVDIIKEAKIQN